MQYKVEEQIHFELIPSTSRDALGKLSCHPGEGRVKTA